MKLWRVREGLNRQGTPKGSVHARSRFRLLRFRCFGRGADFLFSLSALPPKGASAPGKASGAGEGNPSAGHLRGTARVTPWADLFAAGNDVAVLRNCTRGIPCVDCPTENRRHGVATGSSAELEAPRCDRRADSRGGEGTRS